MDGWMAAKNRAPRQTDRQDSQTPGVTRTWRDAANMTSPAGSWMHHCVHMYEQPVIEEIEYVETCIATFWAAYRHRSVCCLLTHSLTPTSTSPQQKKHIFFEASATPKHPAKKKKSRKQAHDKHNGCDRSKIEQPRRPEGLWQSHRPFAVQ